ncbi:MAG: hypothetical protein JSW27_25525 [Phycisphaerales bacterium]|nr:MAG: hypothetical protein JSW27_25525 [Phycisphaerales bacterium]
MTEPQQRISATITADPGPSRLPEPQALIFGRILWHRRYLVALGALLPALLVGVVLHLLPTAYSTTFVYERPLSESEYNVLLHRFYGLENLGKIVAHLRDRGVDDQAARLEQAGTRKALERLIRFEPFPAYPTPLRTSDPEILEGINSIKAQLLYVELTGAERDAMPAIADVITANIEDALPIYDLRDDLRESSRTLRQRIAEIEENVNHSEQMHRYSLKVLASTDRLREEIDRHLPADYTMPQFLDFLEKQLTACEDEELAEHLRSWLRKTQNVMLASKPAVESPAVYTVSKHVLERSVLAFIVALMITTFMAVTLEEGKGRRDPSRSPSAAPGSGG